MVYRVRFAKFGVLKFIGHLDVMRYFQKVVRRSGLPVRYSQGYTPHQILSFALPLGLGVTSDGEYMEIEFTDDTLTEEQILKALRDNTTEGFEILDIRTLPAPEPNTRAESSMSLVAGAKYLVRFKDGYRLPFATQQELWDRFSAFYAQEEITVLKKTKKSEKDVNLKEFIYGAWPDPEASVSEPHGSVRQGIVEKPAVPIHIDHAEGVDPVAHADSFDNGMSLVFTLAAGSQVNIKPELVLEAFGGFLGAGIDEAAVQFHRMELYMTDKRGGLVPMA